MVRRHSTRGLYIVPNISPKKLGGAKAACVVSPDERIIALVDSTLSGNAKKSLLIGTTGIYFRNDWAGKSPGRHFISYDDFRTVNIRKNGFYEVSIGGLNFNVSACSMSKSRVINLLQDVQRCLLTAHETNGSRQTVADQLLDLKKLLDEGILTEEIFQQKKAALIEQL